MTRGARILTMVMLVGLAVFLLAIGESALHEIASLSDPGSPHHDIAVGLSLRTHLHNKAIHLPIGLSIVAFALSAACLKYPHLESSARWCILLAFVASIAAAVAGLGQAGVYEGGGKEWIVVAHRTSAFATLASLGVWTLMAWIRPLRFWAVVLGVVTVLLIGVTGFLGGVVAHG
jgi:uncharacterized membrane protein